MKAWIRRTGKFLMLTSPLMLGLYGFVEVEDFPFLQALYICLGMYGLGYPDQPLNVWIEIARWLAPLATASGLFLVIRHFKVRILNFLAYCTGRSVAVFGPEDARAPLLKELGLGGIAMNETPVKAHKYILLGTEQENLNFYQRHYDRLAGRDVYLKCRDLPAQASNNPKLHLFCPEETAARFFWKTYCPYKLSVQKEHRFRITIIGFGKLGKEILLSALQNNIFHRDQRIEYHILGDENGFSSIFHQLDQISDPVIFHPEPWHAHMALLQESEMVIVTDLPDQLTVLRDLSLALPDKNIHVLSTRQRGIDLLKDQSACIHAFDWQAYSRKKDAILGSSLYEQAMRINLRYAHIYNNIAENRENMLQQWGLLSSFTRYSNISTADYHDIRRIMVRARGWHAPLNEAQIEELAELEHIRWCRYHFLNNWKQGSPTNGKAKDETARIHQLLVPYLQLSNADKEKDRQVIEMLFSLSPIDA